MNFCGYDVNLLNGIKKQEKKFGAGIPLIIFLWMIMIYTEIHGGMLLIPGVMSGCIRMRYILMK